MVEWSNDLSVGVPSIDVQHRKLIDLTNDFHAAIVTGRGAVKAGRTLIGLLAYTVSHFSYEEKVMQEAGYADFEEHKAEHARLVAEIRCLQKDLLAGKTALSVDLMHFMKSWLRMHIAGMDHKYAECLQAAGVK